MATTGVRYPGSNSSVSATGHSGFTWNNPTYVQNDDTSYASVTTNSFDTGTTTYLLKSYNFDTAWTSIPVGATIDGVIVTARMWQANGGVDVDLVQLLGTDGVETGDSLDGPNTLTSSEATYTWGSSTDKWNCSLTDTWVHDSDFGVAIGCISTGLNSDVYVDWVKMEIYYHLDKTVAADIVQGNLSLVDPTVDIQQTVNCTVTPDVIAGALQLTDPTPSMPRSVAADIVQGSLSLVEPTESGAAVTAQSVVQGELQVWNNPSVVVSTTNVPATIEGTFSALAHTVSTWIAVAAEVLAGLFSPIAPAVAGSAVVIPTQIEAQLQAVEPSVLTTGSVTLGVSPIDGSLVVIEPSVQTTAGATVVPNVLSGQFELLGPTESGSAVVAADIIAGKFYTVEPSISISTSVAQAIIGGIFELPAPTVLSEGNVTAIADIVTGAFTLVEPSEHGAANVAADLAAGQFSVIEPSLSLSISVAQGVIGGAFELPTPTVLAGGSVTPVADIVTGLLTIPDGWTATVTTIYVPDILAGALSAIDPSVSISGGTSVSVGVIEGVLSLIDPTIPASASIQVEPVTAVFYLPTFTTNADAILVPTEIDGQFTLLEPTIPVSLDVQVSVLEGVFELTEPSAIGGTFVAVDTLQGTLSLQEPSAIGYGNVATDVIDGAFYPVEPSASGTGAVVPSVIEGQFTLVEPAAIGGTIAPVNALTGYLSLIAPTVSTTRNPTVELEPVTGYFSQPAAFMAKRSYLWVKVSGVWRKAGIS
jgi:hypothetical protein